MWLSVNKLDKRLKSLTHLLFPDIKDFTPIKHFLSVSQKSKYMYVSTLYLTEKKKKIVRWVL